jgi:Fungalysin/Thermolysin Propeptide Motif
MPKLLEMPDSRVTHDPESGAIRTWFAPAAAAPMASRAHVAPPEAARQVLQESADLFTWRPDLPDLRDRAVVSNENAHSVRLTQEFKEIPVDASEVVVNMSADGRVNSIYNNYHYDIPADLDPQKITVTARQAAQLAERLLQVYPQSEIREPELIVYQYHPAENHPPRAAAGPSNPRERFLAEVATSMSERAAGDAPKAGQHYLAWDMIATTQQPKHSWRILVDAMTGRLINVIDLLQYGTGTSQVFDPNPTVTTGDLTFSSATSIAVLDDQRFPVTVDHLDPPIGGNMHLDGTHVRMEEIEAPSFPEPVSLGGDFSFSYSDRNFLAAMVYFHIDRFQEYIQTDLGMTNVANFAIPVDPQGVNGDDNSRYDPVEMDLAFGEGGVPDASDAHVILHEYGHAIQDNPPLRLPPFNLPRFNNYPSGISEGFGDFLAAVYYDDKHVNPANTRGKMMCWDASPFGTPSASWPGRRYDVNWLFDGPEFAAANGHNRGQLWCATMFELYRKLGGDSAYPGVKRAARDLTIRLHLMANFNVPRSGATATQMGQQVEVADGNLGGWRYANGLHKKVIYDTFRRRHLPSYPAKAVDVYVNDGREGGYGSPSGNDLFTENLWDENYWNTQDIWVKTSPYPSAAAQAAGGPADHVEPPVGSPAYLYVRVKNRGTDAAGSGPVTVKAFHCAPGLGLVWPDAWMPMTTPAIPVANVLPGPGNGVVVGPFPWTPTEVGHECVLVVLECANDRAITEDLLATDHVPHADLVPFDNNIAQRNLVPTMPKGRMVRGFFINNPHPEVRTIKLSFESSLPHGWRWQTNLVNTEALRLGPLERRWVELIIDQAEGQEVTHFDRPQQLTVTGTIDERVIGGMTFYVALLTTFDEEPGPGRVARGGALKVLTHPGDPAEPFSLNIPWHECALEGEVEIRIRFHKK